MNRICGEEIAVKLDPRGVPAEFTRNDFRLYKIVEVQECRRRTGAWWDGEAEQTFFCVRTADGGIFQLCCNHGSGIWTISVIQD